MATKTSQSYIKSHTDENLTKYALFLGGLDVTHDVLASYDPFIGGKARLFMTRTPSFIDCAESGMQSKFKKFKHILEYANTAISGINDVDVEAPDLTGGYVGRSFQIPTIAKNNTNSFTVSTYEFSGRPIGEVLHWWVSGVMDLQSGFATYHGVNLPVKQSNHSAEFIYCLTDRTGSSDGIEFACMFANCFPMRIKMDHLNYQSGQAEIAQMDIEFTCTMYESPLINQCAKKLLEKYQILMDSFDFNPKWDITKNDTAEATSYDITTGTLKTS
jgi:hypothetical protein